jgi:hypothetical protein
LQHVVTCLSSKNGATDESETSEEDCVVQTLQNIKWTCITFLVLNFIKRTYVDHVTSHMHLKVWYVVLWGGGIDVRIPPPHH